MAETNIARSEIGIFHLPETLETMATIAETSTLGLPPQFLQEWNPSQAVADKYNAVEKERIRLHEHCAVEHSKVVEKAKPLQQERQQLDALANNHLKNGSRLLADMENEIQKLKTLTDQRHPLALEYEKLMRELSKEQTILFQQELECESYESKIKHRQNEKQQFEKEVQELQQCLDNLNRKENENIEEENPLQLSMKGLQQSIAQTQSQLEEQEEQLKEEQEQLNENERIIQDLKMQLKQSAGEVKDMEIELERLKDEQLQLTLQQADLHKREEQLQAVIEQLQKDLKEKEDGLVRMEIEMGKYMEKIGRLNDELQQLRYFFSPIDQ